MKMSLIKSGCLSIAVVGLFALSAAGIAANEIIDKVEAVESVPHLKSRIKQTITTSSGKTRTFEISAFATDTNEKQLQIYDKPARVRGEKILMLNDGDDIWSYSPKTKRVRHLATHMNRRSCKASGFPRRRRMQCMLACFTQNKRAADIGVACSLRSIMAAGAEGYTSASYSAFYTSGAPPLQEERGRLQRLDPDFYLPPAKGPLPGQAWTVPVATEILMNLAADRARGTEDAPPTPAAGSRSAKPGGRAPARHRRWVAGRARCARPWVSGPRGARR